MEISLVPVYIGVSFLLAFFVETMVEYVFGTPIDNIPWLEKVRPYKWALRYIAAGIGIYFSAYWQIDLVATTAAVIANIMKADVVWQTTPVGIAITGAVIGRGSNYLHEFLVKHLKKPDVPMGAG